MRAAQLMALKFPNEFPAVIESFMEEFFTASKKKPRYFPNSWIHRMKLHYLQPIVFSKTITKRTIEILLNELLNVNNQLNVTYLIEIILAKHHSGLVDILKDESIVSKLKAPAIKSIFSVAIMQLKIEDAFTLLEENFFGIAEMRLETMHDIIMPYVCFQNYGVRSYAQAAIVIMYKSIKSQFGSRKSDIMSRIAQSCTIINESMKFKNAAKFFETLKQDFRFTLKFSQLWTPETFYHLIPLATKMPFDEVIICEGVGVQSLKIAEIVLESDNVISEELPVPTSQESTTNQLNLQQKYLPFKYQIPDEKLLLSMPSLLTFDDDSNSFKKVCLTSVIR